MNTQKPAAAVSLRRALTAGVAAAALAMPAIARAQEMAQPASDDSFAAEEDSATGNQIIVTATKREQTLQETPVAVSVTTAETLEQAQIRDLKDLQSVVPSLRVTQLQSSANTNFIIRGFGNGANNAGIEPSVGVFVDGVYRSRTAAQISDLPDVQRIEVLRGPQSTLFGKNASAGVISITTQAPQFQFGGNVEATYGNFNAIVLKGVVTGPVTDGIALSLAGGYNKRDGYLEDLATGNRENERDRWFVRGQALFDNGGPLTLRLIGDYDRIDEFCCGVVNLRSSAATGAIRAIGGQVTDPANPFADVVYNNFDSINDIKNYGVSGQIDYDLGPAKLTSITAYRRTDAFTNQDVDFTSGDVIRPKSDDVNIKTFTQELRLAVGFGPLDVLIGGYYFNEKVDQFSQIGFGDGFRPYANLLVQGASGGALNVPLLEGTFGALEGNPAKYAGTFFASGIRQSGTFALKDDAISVFGQVDYELVDGLTLTLGGNYTRDKKRLTTAYQSDDTFAAIDFNAAQYAPFRQQLLFQGALAQTVGGLLGLGGNASAAQIQAFAAANPAAFGQVAAGATAFANANANNPAANPLNGLRGLQFNPPFLNVPNSVEDGKTDDDNFSYTARLAYDVAPSLNVYASYATGFKASSFNLSRDSRPALADRTAIIGAGLNPNNLTYGSRFAGPEKSRVYELGIKGSWDYASANLTFFKQEIDGFQSNVFTGTGFALANAGKQSTFGIEFDGQVQPVEAVVLSLAMTYLDPKFDSFPASAIGDISGTTPAGIPALSATYGAQYTLGLGSAKLIARGDFHYESPVQIVDGLPGFLIRNPDGSIADAGPAIAAARPFRREVNDLNASLTLALDNGLQFSAWARNLLDDRYLLSIFDSPAQAGSVSGYPNQPRTYGGTVRFKF